MDPVAGFLTPSRDDLRHDAREVRMHHARIERTGWRSGNQVDDRDS
jgi:hypothetical protein